MVQHYCHLSSHSLFAKALGDILQYGKPRIPGKVSLRANGQVVAQVIPYDWKEAFALPGIRAEVWMDPSVSLQNGGIPQASFYQNQDRKGGVCVVLGAGNIGALVPGDFMHKLFVEGQVVALKMNPVNEYLGPFLEEGFGALIEAGFLQILYGGAQEGSALCNNLAVDSVHMTGAGRTFEAIVFGAGEEGRQRKQPHLQFTKPFSAELGNIAPVIVVPGPWSEKDIKNMSARLGSWLVPNSAHNCLSPRLIIQMKDWDLRAKLNVVHPKSMKDAVVAAAVNKAIEDLRYGSILINNWGGLAHYMTNTPWGAYPGSDIYDIQSGSGFVNNPLMFDRVQKSVIYSDFAPIADPFLANKTNNYDWFRQDTRDHYHPSVANMFTLIWKAMTLKTVEAPL